MLCNAYYRRAAQANYRCTVGIAYNWQCFTVAGLFNHCVVGCRSCYQGGNASG